MKGNVAKCIRTATYSLCALGIVQSFQCVAYHAKQGDQLVTAFSIFLSEVAALPPGDWDEDALLQFINERKEARLRKGWSLVH